MYAWVVSARLRPGNIRRLSREYPWHDPCACERTCILTCFFVLALDKFYIQGGSGNRDQHTMDRRDKQKYTGLSKTISKKGERVGQSSSKK